MATLQGLAGDLPPPKKQITPRGDERKPKRKKVEEHPDAGAPAPKKKKKKPVEEEVKPNKILTKKVKVKKPPAETGLAVLAPKKVKKDLKHSSEAKRAVAELVDRFKPLAPTDAPTRAEEIKLREGRYEMAKLSGTFKKYVPEAQMLLEREELVNSAQLVQRAQLMMMLANIPIAEDQYRRHPTQSYAVALTNFINAVRELMADIEDQRDTGKVALSVVNDVLAPVWQSMASSMVLEIKRTELDIIKSIEDESTRRAVAHRIGEASIGIKDLLMANFNQLRDAITKRINED